MDFLNKDEINKRLQNKIKEQNIDLINLRKHCEELAFKLAKAEATIKTLQKLDLCDSCGERDVEMDEDIEFEHVKCDRCLNIAYIKWGNLNLCEDCIKFQENWENACKEPDPCDGGCGRIWSDEDPYDIFLIPSEPNKRYCEKCYERLKRTL